MTYFSQLGEVDLPLGYCLRREGPLLELYFDSGDGPPYQIIDTFPVNVNNGEIMEATRHHMEKLRREYEP